MYSSISRSDVLRIALLMSKETCSPTHHNAKAKLKQSHNTPMEAQGGQDVYSPYSFTTSALDGVSGELLD
jgi:hypothetical protein